MSVNSMRGIIDQIQFQARQIAGVNNSSTSLAADNRIPFSDFLSESVHALNQMQNHAMNQANAYMSGASGIELNDVMVSLQKSTLALNLGVQVRNKMVSAYQDIMNMPL
ncbi:flagellar hook-basal body complex protein FliE [Pantoea sp. KPR_PJ]|uniref:flagellar hook-basal body complex protein FliE n=1 Tax=Pantoea sp. KPR_PJ TaxID=2738375 RepID=UPI003527C375